MSQTQSRTSSGSGSCLLNIEWSHPLAEQPRLSEFFLRSPAAVYIIVQYSTNRADSASKSQYLVWYLIVGSMRYSLLGEIQPQKVSSSIAGPTGLSIQTPIYLTQQLAFAQQDCVIKFMRYGFCVGVRPQTLDIGLRASQQDQGQSTRSGLRREIHNMYSEATRAVSIQAPVG